MLFLFLGDGTNCSHFTAGEYFALIDHALGTNQNSVCHIIRTIYLTNKEA